MIKQRGSTPYQHGRSDLELHVVIKIVICSRANSCKNQTSKPDCHNHMPICNTSHSELQNLTSVYFQTELNLQFFVSQLSKHNERQVWAAGNKSYVHYCRVGSVLGRYE